jgi:hypothetical protein
MPPNACAIYRRMVANEARQPGGSAKHRTWLRVRPIAALLGHQSGLAATRLIPQGQFHTVPQPELVIDHPQVILDDMFSRSDLLGDLPVLQSLCNELDDSVFTFTGDPGSIAFTC